jgi:hypothetical protein
MVGTILKKGSSAHGVVGYRAAGDNVSRNNAPACAWRLFALRGCGAMRTPSALPCRGLSPPLNRCVLLLARCHSNTSHKRDVSYRHWNNIDWSRGEKKEVSSANNLYRVLAPPVSACSCIIWRVSKSLFYLVCGKPSAGELGRYSTCVKEPTCCM